MSDYSNPLRVTLVFGQGSSGKTTFGLLYVIRRAELEGPWSCAFIFDQNGQISQRLKLPHVGTARECVAALATRWVCFNPYRMFDPDKLETAFDWFCRWSFEACQRGPGRKILFCDDSWEFSAARNLTKDLARVVKLGRFHHLEYFGVTHRPQEYNITIRSLVTEWVAFNTVERADLEAVADYWPGVEKAATLPPGTFIAYNRNTRAELSGRLW